MFSSMSCLVLSCLERRAVVLDAPTASPAQQTTRLTPPSAVVAAGANHRARTVVLVCLTLPPWSSLEVTSRHQRTAHHFSRLLPLIIRSLISHHHHQRIRRPNICNHIYHVCPSRPIPTQLTLQLLGPRESDWISALTGGLPLMHSTMHNPAQRHLCCRGPGPTKHSQDNSIS